MGGLPPFTNGQEGGFSETGSWRTRSSGTEVPVLRASRKLGLRYEASRKLATAAEAYGSMSATESRTRVGV